MYMVQENNASTRSNDVYFYYRRTLWGILSKTYSISILPKFSKRTTRKWLNYSRVSQKHTSYFFITGWHHDYLSEFLEIYLLKPISVPLERWSKSQYQSLKIYGVKVKEKK